jgi:prepilin-type N-terminal cleavage/methylation domain-containing protein
MKRARESQGFTMVELLVTMGIILVVAAIAAPQVTRAVRTYRLSGAASSVANMIQRTRYDAIRRNIITTSRAAQVGGGGQWQVWVDYNNNGAVDADEPYIFLPSDMGFVAQDQVPAVASMNYNIVRVPANGISFNSRGTVDYGVGGAPAVLVVFVAVPNDPSYGYRAIALTPAGKTKIWQASAGGRWR